MQFSTDVSIIQKSSVWPPISLSLVGESVHVQCLEENANLSLDGNLVVGEKHGKEIPIMVFKSSSCLFGSA